jgi:hypothetical protein
MSLNLPPGHHALRLAALTPAHCGDTGGSAAVDRPLAVDVWSGLPYLPHSALKGVLAGRLGNVHSPGGALNPRRAKLFGAPDVNLDGSGRAGSLVFGDGEMLAFPLLLRDGRRAMVAVAATLRELAGHGLLPTVTLPRVDDPRAWEGPVSSADLPALPEPLSADRFGFDARALSHLLAFPGPMIVAAPEAARAFWQLAVEERTLTALGPDRRVRTGSLRTVELIPAGALFVSWVSNLAGEAADLGPAAPLQLGAWEGTGCGYFAAELLSPPPPSQAPRGEAASPAGKDEGRPRPRHETMRTAFLAMKEMQGRPEAARARSAIFDLGPRLAQRGLAVTLAFCLAKAGGGEDEEASERLRTERAAYRWLLRQLFAVRPGASHATLHGQVTAAIREGDSALPADFHESRLWLRRYAETLLAEGGAL